MAIAKRKKGDLAVAQVSTPRGRNLCGFGLVTAGPRELRAYVYALYFVSTELIRQMLIAIVAARSTCFAHHVASGSHA
jgi:hypothetical protein